MPPEMYPRGRGRRGFSRRAAISPKEHLGRGHFRARLGICSRVHRSPFQTDSAAHERYVRPWWVLIDRRDIQPAAPAPPEPSSPGQGK